ASVEKLFTAQVEAIKDSKNVAAYQLNVRNRADVLSGIQQQFELNQQLGSRISLVNDLFLLNSNMHELKSQWARYNGSVEYRSKVMVPGYRFTIDRNKTLHAASDTVIGS